jgi:hypothetical protein
MKTQHNYIIPCAFALVATGLFIRYHIGRRRFNRRGIAGLQHFPTYNKFLVTVIVERLIYFIGTLCLWAGVILLALTGFNHLFKF